MRNIISVYAMKTDKVSHKVIQKRQVGTVKQRSKDMQMRKIVSVYAMKTDKA